VLEHFIDTKAMLVERVGGLTPSTNLHHCVIGADRAVLHPCSAHGSTAGP
jgi:hypothetical protein